ncbi:hypothetical protein QAD02_017209 [Eretmocerus hayati]|uniref:Uncharacterized protein n=3 Tax=Eretmocerus hayati TaxID=131215 RepID=A0ACC2PD99_9HYME|nr:hypothetical protein QAD02_003925 [Eretmocerus hayati]KAJ8674805.1 hypothetical protein QAD02_010591 [Eretmocerus hayati]KAJ8681422.1 hypothetical protein QAD02_017209 [Eretmocerus hayati]
MQSDSSPTCAVIYIKKGVGKFPSDMLMTLPMRFLGPPDENQQRCVKMLEGPHESGDVELIKGIIGNKAPIPEAWIWMECKVLKYCKNSAEASAFIKARKQGNVEQNNNNAVAPPSTLRSKAPSAQSSLFDVPRLVHHPKVAATATPDVTPLQVPDDTNLPDVSREETVTNNEASDTPTSDEVTQHQPKETSLLQETTLDAIVNSITREIKLLILKPLSGTKLNNSRYWISAVSCFKFLLSLELYHLKFLIPDLSNQITNLSKYVENKLPGLESKVTIMETDLNELKTFVVEQRKLAFNENILTFNDFVQKYGLKLPFQSIEEFENFNEQLVVKDPNTQDVSDANIFKDLKTHIVTTVVNRTDMKVSCRHVFRKFTAKPVLDNVTAENQSPDGDKRILKDTHFYRCLEDAFIHIFGADVQTDLPKVIQTIINCGRDWGGRGKRKSGENTRRSKKKSNVVNDAIIDGDNDLMIVQAADGNPINVPTADGGED